MYVYRRGPEKQSNYIAKLVPPFDEETIKLNFGGGQYRLILKRGSEVRKAQDFYIEGEPKRDIPGATPRTIAGDASLLGSRSDVQAIVEMLSRNNPNNQMAELIKAASLNALEIQKAGIVSQQMSPLQMMEFMDRMQARHAAPAASEIPDWLKQILVAAIPAVTGLFVNMLTPKNPLTEFSTIVGAMNEIKGSLGPGAPAQK